MGGRGKEMFYLKDTTIFIFWHVFCMLIMLSFSILRNVMSKCLHHDSTILSVANFFPPSCPLSAKLHPFASSHSHLRPSVALHIQFSLGLKVICVHSSLPVWLQCHLWHRSFSILSHLVFILAAAQYTWEQNSYIKNRSLVSAKKRAILCSSKCFLVSQFSSKS